MHTDRLERIVTFLQAAEALKDTLRLGRTVQGRQESVAEHCWRLGLLALLLRDDLPGIDIARLLELCLVHDLGEVIGGDVPAPDQVPGDDRAAREREDFRTLCAPLPPDTRERMIALYAEYEAGESREAVLAKGLDKIETILQHAAGANLPGFDHTFDLGYARDRTDRTALLRALRAIADARTQAVIADTKKAP